ncbi:MAG: HEAT repeat domain-containing protein, partial [Myxococcota bacterium]
MAKFLPHVERLDAIAFSSTGLLAIAGTRDGQVESTHVHIARLPKLEALHSIEVRGAVHCLAFSEATLCAGTEGGDLLFWNTGETGDSIDAWAPLKRAHRGAVHALAVSGSRLASVGADGCVQVHHLGANGVSTEFSRELSDRELRAVEWSEAGETLMAGGDDGMVRALGTTPDGPVREMDMSEPVFSLAPLGDGRLAAGCGDGSVRISFLEGAADAEDRAKDAAHNGPVRRLIYTAPLKDSANRELPRRLLSISEDGDVKAWQVDTQRKPPTISLTSSAATDAVLIPASARAKAEQRGGTLIVVDRARSLSLVRVDELGKPVDAVDRVHGRLSELRANLNSKKDEVRIESCKALAALPEDEARKALDGVLLGDRRAEVRRAAASAIRDGDRRLSRPALRQGLSDRDPDVRAAVLAALEHIERDTPVAAVRAAAESSFADIRVAAVHRLPPLRERSPLVPGLLAGMLSDSDAKVRTEALTALFSLDPDAPLTAARTALAKGPADVRGSVIVRIGAARLALSTEGEELLENGLDDEDESVRSTALLVSIASRSALIAAIRRVDPHTKEAVNRLESAGTFADAGDAAARSEADLKPLFAAMASRYPDTALRAARLLALIGDARATGALLQLSREPDPTMRRFVVEALMRAAFSMPGDARVVDRLRWLIDDPEPTVRQSAFQCLQALLSAQGSAGELELAALALRAASPDIRVLALPLLVKFGGGGQYAGIETPEGRTHRERADDLLGDALDDEHDQVRGEAFQTLWAWQSRDPQAVLERAAGCRQPEIRRRVVREIPNQKPEKTPWADALLIKLCGDHVAQVGIDAFDATQRPDKKGEKPKSASRPEIFLSAMRSAAPEVRVKALKAAPRASATELTPRIVELVRDKDPEVHTAAIEALDRLDPTNAEGFVAAFASVFFALRVRAMELCGRRHDPRCITPAQELLDIPETHLNRPSDELRRRAASALADLGSRDLLDYYSTLLSDGDPLVREMAGRGLATACVPGDDDYLVAGLDSEDLPVRSWVAEGLARLGDMRAVPVLAGTLAHDHLPIRRGAMMGFVALGPDGVRGLLSGLEDDQQEIQDLAFAVVVARDLALARAGEAPDLLLSALSAKKPELRLAAARLIETRGSDEHERLAAGLAGPEIPERVSDMQDWPEEHERARRLTVLIDSLASDHPQHRYAAAQVLSLRGQPKAFWRESENLLGPSSRKRPRIPFTSWDSEERSPRKRGWIRSLFSRGPVTAAAASTETERLMQTLGFVGGGSTESGKLSDAALAELVFGTYAGLVRQAPPEGEADETHRVRRQATERLADLAKLPSVGLSAVLPVLRRALSDPHHLVRRAAIPAIRGLYPEDSLEPYRLELESAAADVGRSAVDELIARSDGSEEARALAKDAINAPVAQVRRHALIQLPRLFEAESIEPWLWALGSRYADLRSTVIDRLMDSSDDRVLEAIGRALESDHEDLRLKAAVADSSSRRYGSSE